MTNLQHSKNTIKLLNNSGKMVVSNGILIEVNGLCIV